jgi:hypothetical protein
LLFLLSLRAIALVVSVQFGDSVDMLEVKRGRSNQITEPARFQCLTSIYGTRKCGSPIEMDGPGQEKCRHRNPQAQTVMDSRKRALYVVIFMGIAWLQEFSFSG